MLRTGSGEVAFEDGASPRPLSFDTPTAAPDAYREHADGLTGLGGGAKKKDTDMPVVLVLVGLVAFLMCVVGVLVYTSDTDSGALAAGGAMAAARGGVDMTPQERQCQAARTKNSCCAVDGGNVCAWTGHAARAKCVTTDASRKHHMVNQCPGTKGKTAGTAKNQLNKGDAPKLRPTPKQHLPPQVAAARNRAQQRMNKQNKNPSPQAPKREYKASSGPLKPAQAPSKPAPTPPVPPNPAAAKPPPPPVVPTAAKPPPPPRPAAPKSKAQPPRPPGYGGAPKPTAPKMAAPNGGK